MRNLASYKLVLYVICIVAVLFIATVGDVFAQGPVYNPPVYTDYPNPQGWNVQYHQDRTTYDIDFTYRYSQYTYNTYVKPTAIQAYNESNAYWQSYQEVGVFGRVADPNW